MMKTARMMVRMEPQYQIALERIADQSRPPTTVSALVRLAVVEYIARKQMAGAFADRLMVVADGETLNQV